LAQHRREMPNRVVAAGIEQRHFRPTLQSIVAFLLRRSAEQQELNVRFASRDTGDQLEVSVLTPLLQRPSSTGAGVEADDRPPRIEADRSQVLFGALAFAGVELQHVAVPSSAKAK